MSQTAAGRCTGHCCRQFPLTATLAEVKTAAEKVLAGAADRYQDSVFVADMLVPLEPGPDGKEYFTCRHHDVVTGNCTVYEQRPRLCREHPFYGRPDPRNVCSTAGCTLDHEAAMAALIHKMQAEVEPAEMFGTDVIRPAGLVVVR